MTVQFKKFLLFIISLGLGYGTAILLTLILNLKGEAGLGAFPAFVFYILPLSLISMVIYYHLLRKFFLK